MKYIYIMFNFNCLTNEFLLFVWNVLIIMLYLQYEILILKILLVYMLYQQHINY